MNLIQKLVAARTEAEVNAIVSKEFEAKKNAGNGDKIAKVAATMFGGDDEPMGDTVDNGKRLHFGGQNGRRDCPQEH